MDPTPSHHEIKTSGRFSRRLLIELGLFLLSLFFFAYILHGTIFNKGEALDEWGWELIAPLHSPGMTTFMENITFLGSWFFLLPAYLVLIFYFLLVQKRRAVSLDILAIGVTSTVLMFSIKEIFKRQRPLEPLLHAVPGFSFPSGHSFSSFTFFGLLVYVIVDKKDIPVWVKWLGSIACLLLAALIATSRVYLRVHYPSDVIAGFLLCVIWLGISFIVLHRIRGKRFLDGY